MVGQEAAVVLSEDGITGASFVDDLKVHEFMLTTEDPEKLLLGFRCHPYGKAEVIEGMRKRKSESELV